MSRFSWAFLLVATIVLAGAPLLRVEAGERGIRYAFLVGCSKYLPTQFRELPYSDNDVLGFRDALVTTGFDPEHIIVMQDGAKAAARYLPEKAKIMNELALLLDGMRPQDTLVVALSGHGLQYKNDPVSYFVPVDGKVNDKSTLIPLSGKGGFYERLKACKAKQKLLIVNACRNDPSIDPSLAANTAELVDVDREEVPEGIAAIYSCRAGQKSYYDKDYKRGLFFEHVIRAWRGDYSRDGAVTLEDVFEKVRDKTKTDASRKLQAAQTPVVQREYKGEWVVNAFVSLFNGRDLSGWDVVGTGKWSVTDGVIRADGGGMGFLATNKKYTDFALELEYRLPVKGNSGIFIRASKDVTSSTGNCAEVQLLDDKAYPNEAPYQLTGAIFKEIAPNPILSPPAEKWHRVFVRAQGRRIQVIINGVRVVNADINRPEKSGYIGLQMWRTGVEFKNVRVLDLAP
jgi:hypothetical protein